MFLNRKDNLIFYMKRSDIKYPRKSIFLGLNIQYLSNFEGIEEDGVYSKYNSLGWRCDEFTTDHKDKYHVLFSGCSETMGQGDSIENAWSYIVNQKINQIKQTSGFYSLAGSGQGWEDIINNIREYINNFGTPDVIFILLPDLWRHISWTSIDENNNGRYCQIMTTTADMKDKVNLFDLELTPTMANNLYINFALTMQLFEDFCDSKKIKLIWSTWEYWFNHMIKVNNIRFKYYEPLLWDEREVDSYLRTNNKLTVVKDDGHIGTAVHRVWADKIYQRWDKIINGKF